MKNEEIIRVISGYYNLFPQSKPMPEKSVPLFAELLSDLPVGLIQRALSDIAKRSKFWPTVAEIREAAAAVKTDEERAAEEAIIKAKHQRFREHQLKALGVDADGI